MLTHQWQTFILSKIVTEENTIYSLDSFAFYQFTVFLQISARAGNNFRKKLLEMVLEIFQ